MTTRHVVLGALMGGAFASPSASQHVPVVQVGASGRYETQLDAKTRVPGFTAAQVTAFRPHVERLAQTFAAMPQVTSPPAPICHRLRSWIELNPFHGVLAAEVAVVAPISFGNGRCHRMTRTGVFARVNALSMLLDEQEAFVRTEGPGSDWFLVPQAAVASKVVRIRNAIAFTHGRAPLLRTVSVERYLRERISRQPADPEGGAAGELAPWLGEGKPKKVAGYEKALREMAASMKPADLKKVAEAQEAGVRGAEQAIRHSAERDRDPSERQRLEAQLASIGSNRDLPACFLSARGELDFQPGCPNGFVLAELNPAYFDRSRPDAVQLLVVETPEERTHGENDASLAARMAVWKALDHARLAALVQ